MGTLRTTNIQHADASAAGMILAADGTVSGLRATQNVQSGTTYSLALTDSGRTVTTSNAAAVTVTLPAQATVAWNVGETLSLLNLGVGTVTITPAADVTINGTPLTLATSKGGSLVRTASNVWTFIPFSGGVESANFTNTATGTYSSGGINYKYKTYIGNGSVTIDAAGECTLLVLGGGAGGTASQFNGMGGYTSRGTYQLAVGTHTVTIGAGGAGGGSADTNRGSQTSLGAGLLGYGGGVGSDGANSFAFDDDITGTAVNYAGAQNSPTVDNRGQGGNAASNIAGSSGVVIIRVVV